MSRRKPALRIGGGVMNRNNLYQTDDTKSGGLGLLGTYQDSDSEDNTASASYQLTKAINNLDSKVADFLKEIDQLEATDTQEEKSKSDPKEISYGSWQQCIDENTQHPYYWNTSTDEVTWVLPEEISKQLEQAKNSTDAKASAEEVSTNAAEIVNSDENSDEKDQKEDAVAQKHTEIEKVNEESYDIDVYAELDQALENTESKESENESAESFSSPTQLDLDLEVLRRGDLPLSDGEEEDLLIRFEADILKLEEGEEEKRKSGTWKIYEKEIEQRKQEINLDKTKWREERLPELKRMRIDGILDTQEEHKTNLFQKGVSDSEKEEETVEMKEPMDENEQGHSKETDTTQIQPHNNVEAKEPVVSEAKSDSTDKSFEDEMSTLSSTIIDKLAFIGVSKRDFTNFHRLLIEIETRVADCQDGLLPASYVVAKLQAATQQLKAYEDTATPEGWSCHWDRNAKRYFYMNNDTKKMQWQYPEVKETDKSEANDNGRVADTKEADSGESNQKKRAITGSDLQNGEASKSKKPRSEGDQAIDVENKSKNTAENPDGAHYTYPYGSFAAYQQMISTPPPPGEDEQDAQPPLPSLPAEVPPPPPPPPAEEDVEGDVDTKTEDDGIMMEMSEDEDEDKKVDTANTAIMSQPILYKPSDMAQASMMNYAMYAAASTAYQEASSPLMQTIQQGSTTSNNAITAKQMVKIKTKKKSKKSAAVKKPAKGMSSLVAQWQKAKNQIEEEDRLLEQDGDDEVDHETLTKQQIEKWKADQIMSGRALTNSNFEPIPGDWRSRILKKKKGKG